MYIKRESSHIAQDNTYKKHILWLQFLYGFTRVGFLTSAFVLLVIKFDLTILNSAIVTIMLQGVTLFANSLCDNVFSKFSIKTIQISASAIGSICSAMILFTNNFYIFVFVIFICSFAKVSFEVTIPILSHNHIESDKTFASKIVGYNMAGILCVSALTATLVFLNLDFLPIAITSLMFGLLCFLITSGYIQYSQNAFEKTLKSKLDKNNKSSFENRTLSMIDLSSHIVGGLSVCIMPVALKTVSHLSQGVDSLLFFIFGLTACICGVFVIPKINTKINISIKAQWHLLLYASAMVIIGLVLYCSYFGLFWACFGAVIEGVGSALAYSLIHTLAAKELNGERYKTFCNGLNQRSARSRIIAAISLGFLSQFFNIQMQMFLFIAVAFTCVAICIIRVSIITRDLRLIEQNEISTFIPKFIGAVEPTAYSLYTGDDRRRSTIENHSKTGAFKSIRRHNRTITRRSPLDSIRDHHFEIRRVLAFSQTYSQVVTTWRSHRFRRNTYISGTA